jgi:hypothetical protein
MMGWCFFFPTSPSSQIQYDIRQQIYNRTTPNESSSLIADLSLQSGISMSIFSFLSGFVVGGMVALLGLLYYLMQKDGGSNKSTKPQVDKVELKEKDISEEQMKILVNAVNVLRGGDETESAVIDGHHPTEEQAPVEFSEMETAFSDFAKEAKDRQKHYKSLCSFLQEWSRVHGQFSKDLTKLSNSAEIYVKGENNVVLDKWWNSMSIALEHLSKDQKSISTSIHDDIYPSMLRVEQEQLHLEKKVSTEGSKLVQRMKDTQQSYDAKLKELEKLREKSNIPASTPLIGTASSSAAASSANPEGSASTTGGSKHQGDTDAPVAVPIPSKATATKLVATEAALADWSSKLATAQQEFNEKMPRILADYKLMATISLNTMMELLIQLSDQLAVAQEKSSQVTHRLKVDLASSAAKSKDRCNYNPVVRELLEGILAQQSDGETGKLDMKLESSAGLAASCLAKFPPLPRQFDNCIGNETCVWLNALSGRMYRDAARSSWFNKWFCTKITNLLNKGKRSPLIDKYEVVDATLGGIPPLLLNVKWSPVRPAHSGGDALPPVDLDHDVECTADVAFRSSLAFTVQTK